MVNTMHGFINSPTKQNQALAQFFPINQQLNPNNNQVTKIIFY